MKTKQDNKSKNTEKKGFFKKFIENVAEGATAVGEKVAGTSAKAYVAGSDLVAETSEKIHEYTEKQILIKEEKNILENQKELMFMFGKLTLKHYLKNKSLHKTFLSTKVVNDVVEKFKANEKRNKAIHKELNKLEEH